MWSKIGEEMSTPWRAAEAMHWQIGEEEMARRAGTVPFSSQRQEQLQQRQQQPPPYSDQSTSSARYNEQQHNSQWRTVSTATKAPQPLVRQILPGSRTFMQPYPFLTSSVDITTLNSDLQHQGTILAPLTSLTSISPQSHSSNSSVRNGPPTSISSLLNYEGEARLDTR
jgi:hypothetical protein